MAEALLALPKRIETERLILRPIRLSDAGDVQRYTDDPEWARYYPVALPRTEDDVARSVARAVLAAWLTDATWIVEHAGEVIGDVQLNGEPKMRRAALGWSIARPHWNNGFASEAGSAIVDVAFATWPYLVRILAVAHADNRASARVMEKLGMQFEGRERLSWLVRGELFDMVCYAILREDWERTRRAR